MCNNNTNLKVRFSQQMSRQFKVQNGLRQDNAPSPTLFNIALKRLIRDIMFY